MAARSMGNIVDILGQAENIVLGLKSLDTTERPNIFCSPLRIGRPILEPLDSSMEPTPLGPTSTFIPKLLQRSTEQGFFGAPAANFPKWMTTADMAYSQSQQQTPMVQSQQQGIMPLPQAVSQPLDTNNGNDNEGNFDHSLSSLDDTPLCLEYVDDLEDTHPALVSSSSLSSHMDSASDQQDKKRRVRKYKEDQWNVRFQDLLQFRADEGHVMVPHSYPKNQKLAQWVKR